MAGVGPNQSAPAQYYFQQIQAATAAQEQSLAGGNSNSGNCTAAAAMQAMLQSMQPTASAGVSAAAFNPMMGFEPSFAGSQGGIQSLGQTNPFFNAGFTGAMNNFFGTDSGYQNGQWGQTQQANPWESLASQWGGGTSSGSQNGCPAASGTSSTSAAPSSSSTSSSTSTHHPHHHHHSHHAGQVAGQTTSSTSAAT